MRFILSILAALIAVPTLLSSAQESVDIPALSEQVAAADAERLLMGLNTPMTDDMLPEGFSDARLMDRETLAQQRTAFNEAFSGISGSVVYTLDYVPGTASASPEAVGSGTPVAREQQPLYSSSTLTYLVFTDVVDTSDPEEFATSVQTAMGSEARQGTVNQITLGDTPALLISSLAVVNNVEIHTQWIAVPIGKVVVVGMVMTGTDTFVEEAFLADNEALIMSGVAWLGHVISE